MRRLGVGRFPYGIAPDFLFQFGRNRTQQFGRLDNIVRIVPERPSHAGHQGRSEVRIRRPRAAAPARKVFSRTFHNNPPSIGKGNLTKPTIAHTFDSVYTIYFSTCGNCYR